MRLISFLIIVFLSFSTSAQIAERDDSGATLCVQWDGSTILSFLACREEGDLIPQIADTTVTTLAEDSPNGTLVLDCFDAFSAGDTTGSGHSIEYTFSGSNSSAYSIDSATCALTLADNTSISAGTDTLNVCGASVYNLLSGSIDCRDFDVPIVAAQGGLDLSINSTLNVVNNSDFGLVQSLNDGGTLDLADMPSAFNIQATPNDGTDVDSMRMVISSCDASNRIENEPPYSLYDELTGQTTLTTGACQITVTGYSQPNLGGSEGIPLVVNFTVVDTTPVSGPVVPNGTASPIFDDTASGTLVYTVTDDNDVMTSCSIISGNTNSDFAISYSGNNECEITTVDNAQIAGMYSLTVEGSDGSNTDTGIVDITVNSAGQSSGDVSADIQSLVRLNGVSPETFYFNADGSTCSDCTPLYDSGDSQNDIAYSVLSYHFNFDDSDSGTFDTTGNSRNEQISGSPRAAHTFHCFGDSDPNWDPVDQRCEFNVGVRVQALDNDYDDAFVQVNVQPAVGVGGYYADSDVICVSSTSDFSDCLALAPGASTQTDVPTIGNWDNTLAIIDNDGGSYSTICMGMQERNGAAIAYGPDLVAGAPQGSRPTTGLSILSSRPDSCSHIYTDTSVNNAGMASRWPERDGSGALIDGWGFGQKVVGVAVGRVRVGQTGNFIQYHNIAAGVPNGSGEISMLSAAAFCRQSVNITCSNMPSASFIFLTDSTSDGDPSNLPVAANIGCFNTCDLTNPVIMGVRANTSNEHNMRLMGAWGLILSNIWMQGDHIGGAGPKAQVSIRQPNDCCVNDLSRDPEDLTTLSNYTRAADGNDDFVNSYLMSINNRMNQNVHAANHDGGAMHMIAGLFTIEDGTYYYSDSDSTATPKVWMEGVYKVVRNLTIESPSTTDCGYRTNRNPPVSAINDGSEFYYEGTPTCSGGAAATLNIQSLPTPAAPGG